MLGFLQRLGFRRGVVGASRVWFWVAVLATGARILSRIMGRSEKVLFSQELEPGQTLVIAHEREVVDVDA